MNKIIKPVGIALIAGGTIYGGMQMTANSMVDEVLTTEHIKSVEDILGGSLSYEKAGVNSKFSPVLNKIEISDILPGVGSKLLIDNITINELDKLNFNIDLNKVSIKTDSKMSNKDDKFISDLLSKGADITVINKCENDRCNSSIDVKVPGMASVRIELGVNKIELISAALKKINLESKPFNEYKNELAKELDNTSRFAEETVEEFVKLYQLVHKDGKNDSEKTIQAITKNNVEDIRRKTLFRALNDELVREAPSKEVKDLLVVINELSKADISMSVKISKLVDSDGNMNVPQLGQAENYLSKIITNRFKDISVSVDKLSDDVIFGISVNGMEATSSISATVSSPTIVEIAQINDKSSYDKVASKINITLKTDGNSNGFGLDKTEITQIIDLINSNGMPIPNRNELEKWLFENIDKITSGVDDSKISFNVGSNELTTKINVTSPLFNYDDDTMTTMHKGNFKEEVLEKARVKFEFNELMEVIYSGIKAVSGEVGYQAIVAQRDLFLSKNAIIQQIKVANEMNGIDISKFFASMGVKGDEELAEAIEKFVKNPGSLNVNFSYPDNETNPLIPIMYPDYSDDTNGAEQAEFLAKQSMDKYLSIEIHPK